MENLKPIIFLVPTIALILVSLLYGSFLKKATDKKAFNQFFLMMTVLGFILNFAWELLQMPLYDNTSFKISHVGFCALGSVADAIMVVLIYFSLAIVFKTLFWMRPLKWQRIIVAVLIGGVGSVLSEIRDLMQLLPIIKVGLSPVLQFMILPVLIYILSLKLSLLENNSN